MQFGPTPTRPGPEDCCRKIRVRKDIQAITVIELKGFKDHQLLTVELHRVTRIMYGYIVLLG